MGWITARGRATACRRSSGREDRGRFVEGNAWVSVEGNAWESVEGNAWESVEANGWETVEGIAAAVRSRRLRAVDVVSAALGAQEASLNGARYGVVAYAVLVVVFIVCAPGGLVSLGQAAGRRLQRLGFQCLVHQPGRHLHG